MIMEKSNPPSFTVRPNDQLSKDSLLQKILSDIELMKKEMREKDAEIGELNARLSSTEDTVTKLRESVNLLEEKLKNLDGNTNSTGSSEAPFPVLQTDKKLLLGDSTLSQVKSSDLGINTNVRTLPEANFNILKSWITEKLNYSINDCIIYCGIQDLKEDKDPKKILDDLGDLVAAIKSKNDNVTLSICEIIPVLENNNVQDKIDDFNFKLTEFCDKNQISLIKTVPYFKLGTGETDLNCFMIGNDLSTPDLSRVGVVRLLDAIYKCNQDYLSSKWLEIKRRDSKQVSIGLPNRTNEKTPRTSQGNYFAPLSNNLAKNNFDVDLSRDFQSQYRSNLSSRHKNPPNPTTTLPHSSRSFPSPQFSRQLESSRQYTANKQSPSHINRQLSRQGNYENSRKSVRVRSKGCFNCGEYNHNVQTCRFDHKLRCSNCKNLGHKSKLCQNYNQ